MQKPRNRGRVLLVAFAILCAGTAASVAVIAARTHDADERTREPRADEGGGFVDRALEAGIRFHATFLAGEQGEKFKINFYDHGAGLAVADYDGDGDDDIYFLSQLGPNALYRNDGHANFTDVTEAAGVALPDRISVAATFADVDGDGALDLYVTTTRGGNVLFRNRGDGSFEDVTAAAGLALVAHPQVASFFDADGDGDPDLLVTNTAAWTTDRWDERARYFVGPATFFDLLMRSAPERNRFYRNRGDGVFDDATEASGLGGGGWGGDIAIFDFDADGDLDVFVANMFGHSHLFANDGEGHFREVTGTALGKTPWGTVGARALDYDGDGRLDLLLVDMHSDMWMRTDVLPPPQDRVRKFSSPWGPGVERGERPPEAAKLFAQTFDADPNRVLFGNALYRNLGAGVFEERSNSAGLETLWPWGIAAGDFDADGNEDVFLPSGMGYPYPYLPSPLLLNRGDGTFRDATAEAGLDPDPDGAYQHASIGGAKAARSARAAATADFDGDGRLDLVVNRFNDRPLLWMNRYPRRHHVAIRLKGTRSGRDAVGALVRLRVGGRTYVRQVNGACGYLSQSSHTLHFGLGDATRIDHCEIRWPSGLVETPDPPAVDTLAEFVEPRN